ncbi:MAG: hypothetical protein IJU98_00795 [Synergistaceae bacterium]|nr:hypothetical protein [Synergistaceae bacterium]
MTEQEFLTRMKKILDNEDVTMDSTLADIEEWDSLSVVSYVAMANTVCGKKIAPAQLKDCATLCDLYALLGQ